jgi:hypothetical protein
VDTGFPPSRGQLRRAKEGPKRSRAPWSWIPEKSQVESGEYQDNANIHSQPFPESAFEKYEIYTNYDGRHRQAVKHDSYLSVHLSPPCLAATPAIRPKPVRRQLFHRPRPSQA